MSVEAISGENRQRTDELFLSVVVPMHNEAGACSVLFETLIPVIDRLTPNYEVICIDDGSSDTTLDCLRAANRFNPRIKIIALTRNFGKDFALTAGIDAAQGSAVIPMDADLQDPPEVIPDLVAKWREGFDMVLAVRSERPGDGWIKWITAQSFYKAAKHFSEPLPANAGDFRLMSRNVVDVLKACPERTRFMKGLFAWTGFPHATVHYARPGRSVGATKWKPRALWNFALGGIFSSTTLPLRIWTYLGMLVALIAVLRIGYTVSKTLLFGPDVPGYPSVSVMILFFSGINMIGLGILGEYLGRVFIEVKQRPLYIVQQRIGFEPIRES